MILPISGSLFAEIVPTWAISFRPLLGAEIRFSSSTTNSTALSIVGFPNFLSMTTLRPLGPRVTFTASASWSTPRLRRERASVLNSRYLAVICFLSRSAELGDDVGFLDQDDLFLVQLDLRAGVLPVDDPVADLQLHRDPLALFQPAGPDRDDLTLDRLLLGRVRDIEATFHLLSVFQRPDRHAIGEWEDLEPRLRRSSHDAPQYQEGERPMPPSSLVLVKVRRSTTPCQA